MKTAVTILSLVFSFSTLAIASKAPIAVKPLSISAKVSTGCKEMDDAANAIARINGANYAAPSFHIAEVPVKTSSGQQYIYQFNAYGLRFKTVKGKRDKGHIEPFGVISITALRKSGDKECHVQTVSYSDSHDDLGEI